MSCSSHEYTNQLPPPLKLQTVIPIATITDFINTEVGANHPQTETFRIAYESVQREIWDILTNGAIITNIGGSTPQKWESQNIGMPCDNLISLKGSAVRTQYPESYDQLNARGFDNKNALVTFVPPNAVQNFYLQPTTGSYNIIFDDGVTRRYDPTTTIEQYVTALLRKELDLNKNDTRFVITNGSKKIEITLTSLAKNLLAELIGEAQETRRAEIADHTAEP